MMDELLRLSRWLVRLTLAGLVLAIVECTLPVFGLRRVARALGIRVVGDVAPTTIPTSAGFPVVTARWVDAARRVVGWRRTGGRCLRESLVVGALLHRRHPVLRIGVIRRPTGELRAHAWIEVDGATYDPEAPRFGPLEAIRA